MAIVFSSHPASHCRQAHTAGCSLTTFVANNETGILESGPGPAFSPKANEIFHCEGAGAKLPLPGLKRKFGGDAESSASRPKVAASAGSGASLISPPLFKPRPNLAMVPGYPHEAGPGGHNNEHAAPGNQEDEWKNIKVVSSGGLMALAADL